MKVRLNPKNIWTISLVLYIICSSAFSYGSLKMLNSYALYLFLGVSAVCIFLKGKIKLNATVASLILYAILMLLGLFYTPASNSEAMSALYNYGTMAMIVICVVQYVDTVDDIETVITAFMWAGLALAVYVYAQYGNEFWELMQSATDYESGHIGRLGEELTNANTIGMVTAISTMIAVYKLIYKKTGLFKRLMYIAIAVFCFLIDMGSASKKGLLLLLLVALGMWFYSALGNKSFGRQIRNLLVLCLVGAGLFWMINNLKIFSGISVRLDSFFDLMDGATADASSETRSYYIRRGLEIWLEHPLFGAGTVSSDYYFGVYSHNNYVELLMNSGLIGFLVFYLPPVAGFFKYLLSYKTCKAGSSVSGLLFALLISVFVCGVGLVYYYDRYFMILSAVIVSAPAVFEKSLSETAQLGGKEETV